MMMVLMTYTDILKLSYSVDRLYTSVAVLIYLIPEMKSKPVAFIDPMKC